MQSTFRLGRFAGVDVGANWTWLIVFALIAWTLAAGIFPETNPGLGEGTYWTMAAIAAVLFFASILAHELGHAVQARRDGMEIDGITLWLFGGVARFRGMFPSAGAEFRIAIAGPIVSLAIGVGFVLLSLVALPDAVDGVAAWLGYINLSVLVFNLLPALPLDGGRVLRSALWRARGDFAWATRIAAGAGRGFGFLLIGLGVFMLIVQGQFSGVWLGFLGWFLLTAAEAELRHSSTAQALGGLRVRDVMVREPVTAVSTQTIGDFLDTILWPNRYSTYPVVRDGRPVGLLPFACVAQTARRDWDARTVGDCMIPLDDVPQVRSDADLVATLVRLQEPDGTGHALVVAGDGRLEGLLSLTDIARALETPRPRRMSPPEIGTPASSP